MMAQCVLDPLRGVYVPKEFTMASGEFFLPDHILPDDTDLVVSEQQDRA